MSTRIVPGPVTSTTGVAAGLCGVYDCEAGVALHDVVFIDTVNNRVDKADADDATKQPVIGIVSQKVSPTQALVQYAGEMSGFVGLTEGAIYYLGLTPGTMTDDTSGYHVGDIIHRLGIAKNPTVLVVAIDPDFIVL